MADDKDGKIGGIGKAKSANQIEKTEQVDTVGGVKKAGKVSAVKGAGATSGAAGGQLLTPADREPLFKMIEEEAEKLFGKDSSIPQEQKDAIAKAVKMAVDAAIIDEEGGDEDEES